MSVELFIKNAKKSKKKVAESTIESKFVKYADKLGCKAYKLVIFSGAGFPDRTVLCPGGKIFFIEFKSKRGCLSMAQKIIRAKLEALGFVYYVCNEIGQAEKVLSDALAT